MPGFCPGGAVGLGVDTGVAVAVGCGVWVGAGVAAGGVALGTGRVTALGAGLGNPGARFVGWPLRNGAWLGALLPVGEGRVPEVWALRARLPVEPAG